MPGYNAAFGDGGVIVMGMARLLAKAWILVCLYAGAYALIVVLEGGADVLDAVAGLGICVALFAAMGLLFAGGYGLSAGHDWLTLFKRIKPSHFIPGFNDAVFAGFVVLSFADQVLFAPAHLSGIVTDALERAIFFAIPGQRALVAGLQPCMIDGGRVFASAFAWFLAIVYLCSALSRLRLAAGILRLERAGHPEALGATPFAFLLGMAAIAGIQFFLVGSGYALLPCSALAGLAGALVAGLAPLMLAYLIVAAVTALLASGKTK